MSHTIEIPDDIARITFEGPLTMESWRSALDAVLSHPAFRPGLACLWNMRGVSEGGLGHDSLEEIAVVMRDRGQERGEGRSAIVAARDVDFGAARQYQMKFAQGVAVHFRPFQDLDEAEAWLRTPLEETSGGGAADPHLKVGVP